MKSLRILLFCVIAQYLALPAFAQKIGGAYLPPVGPSTPEWFKVFYRPDFPNGVNVMELDQTVVSYVNALEAAQRRDATSPEVLSGEEDEDIYANYYKRWRRFNDSYIGEDGFVRAPDAAADAANEAPAAQKVNGPSSSWTLLGPKETFWDASSSKAPWQSNIYACAVAPSDPNILYACPETGMIFKTTDKGLNWDCKTMNYPVNTLTAIQVHPTDPNIVYGARNNQLVYSTDGGSTWSLQAMPWGNVNTIQFKPSAPDQVFVAAEKGLYRYTPAGMSISQDQTFNINALATGDPTWVRNSNSSAICASSAGTSHFYRVFSFTVSAGGSYTFSMCTPSSNWDAHASLFQNAFNPANPCATLSDHLYSDDDANSGGNCNDDPSFTVALSTGVTYYLVTTSYNPEVTGTYQWNFTGPSGATLTGTAANWVQLAGMNTTCSDMAFKSGNDNVAYCLKQNSGLLEFWRSTDGGNTYAASITGWPLVTQTSGRMTTTAADPNRLYAVLLGDAPATEIPRIVRSTDGGANWTVMCTGVTGLTGNTSSPLGMSNGQGYYDLDIVANPNNADQVIVGTTTAYRSTDGGATFTPLGGYNGSFGIHPDIQEMIAIGNDTWITTDGGLSYSSDFFATTGNFSPRFKGIFSSDMWGFGQGWNEDIVGGGRYHNGNTAMSEAYPDGEAIRLGGGEQATGYYMIGRPRHIAFSDISPKIVPTNRNGALVDFSFNKFPNEDGYGNDMSEIEFLPYCYNHIYTGNGNDFWKSTDGGISWTSLHTFTGRVKEFEISRTNPNIIYLATNTPTQLHKSADGGITWNTLTLPSGASAHRVSLALSFTDENKLWMVSPSNTSGNRVFMTTDGGATWSNLTTTAINGQSYTAIVHQQGTDNGLYILGDDAKVFYKSDSEADWVAFNSGLPPVHNNEHILPFYRDSKLRSAGNHGVWEVDFYEEGAPIAQPTVDKLSTTCGRDTFYFEDYSALKHTEATWSWSFPGASYVSSATVRNPKVTYNTIGTYDVSLTVTNPQGSSTKSYTGMVQVIGNECVPDTIPGHALTLAATTDYAVQSRALGITTNNMTLSAWIKPTGIQAGNAGIIFSGSGGASGLNFISNNQIGYHWADNAGTYNWTGGPTVPANEWSHVALVIKDGTGTSDTAVVYLNGVPYQRIGTHNPVTFSTAFQLGRDRSNTARNFVGLMDEVVMYNRALTRAEIRELMNLTRNNPNAGSMPSNDPALLSYYQFNELQSLIPYDKVDTRHLTLAGNAHISGVSSAPVGGGRFHRMNVSSGGVKDFSDAWTTMEFPATGTYPNGELVVTRLNVPPDQPCATYTIPQAPEGYWVVRNYGTNTTFSNVVQLSLKNITGTTAELAGEPSIVQLYKRASNQDGMTWATPIDDAESVTHIGGKGDVTFSTGLPLTNFSQFALGLNESALPVELLHFSGILMPQQWGLLTWETAQEMDLKGYELQYSPDGRDFIPVTFVPAQGRPRYEYTHGPLAPGQHYYRLKMLDTDGHFALSSIVLLEVKGAAIQYAVYPNPSDDGWFHFEIQGEPQGDVQLSFGNMAGQIVHQITLHEAGKHLFYLPFPAGVYTLTIRNAHLPPEQRRIVVER